MEAHLTPQELVECDAGAQPRQINNPHIVERLACARCRVAVGKSSGYFLLACRMRVVR